MATNRSAMTSVAETHRAVNGNLRTFNPYRGACGFYPPDVVGRRRDLTDGQKRLYERLVRRAGDNGACFPSFKLLAFDLGKSERQVKSDMAALERYPLITHVRYGRRLANSYQFLWHPIFDSRDVQPTALHPDGEVQDTSGDVQSTALGDVQSTAHEFSHKNSVHGIESSSAIEMELTVPDPLTAEFVDDDPSPQRETQNPVHECLLAFVSASGISMPRGKVPDQEIAGILQGISATEADLVNFLKAYSERWNAAPVTWKHVLSSLQHWASDPKTLDTIRSLATLRMAAEQDEREKLEIERVWSTPTSPEAAITMAEQSRGRAISDMLRRQLCRVGEPVSPAEVSARAQSWRRCRECGDSGSVGNPIDRTLRFCECYAGIEARYRDGADWPERRTAEVHSDARSLLAEAMEDLRLMFSADAMRLSEIFDDGERLEIYPRPEDVRLKTISQSDVARALDRVRWKRTVSIAGEGMRRGVMAESNVIPLDTARAATA